MSKAKHEHHRLEEFKTAIESLSLEAIPAFARIGQETGLGASLPEDTPEPESVTTTARPVKTARKAKQSLGKSRTAATRKANATTSTKKKPASARAGRVYK